jgi:hypothetical protein
MEETTREIRGPIKTKPQLIARLWEASEIEQQLMVQYLYAAFSMKKRPDERCNAAQFEFVRRWASTLLMVARQEMEHLALVNGLLSAIGAEPYFARENIPLQSPYYLGAQLGAERGQAAEVQPCDVPFLFERFNLATIGRFVCAESPGYDTLKKSGDPIPTWCFSAPGEPCPTQARKLKLARTHVADVPSAGDLLQVDIHPGSIQELYDQIQTAFNELPDLFTGDPSRQVFVPVEYQINIFPIVDVASANTAIRLIVEEGEGIDAPPGYQSHFRRFYDIRCEFEALLARDPEFDPSLPLPLNPTAEQITNPFARRTFDLFNYSYATLLFVLSGLYRYYVPPSSQSYPFFSSALQETAFGPAMTMLLRPIAEVLAHTKSGDGEHTTGPDYHLSPEDEALLLDPDKLDNIDFFLDRFAHIVSELGALSGADLAANARCEDDVAFLQRQLRFVHESATAMANNMRRIYQIGQLPQFVVT